MPSAAVNRIESRRQSDDCGVWALATYLGVPYEQVFAKVVKLDRSKGKNGLTTPSMQRIAKALGHPLELKKRSEDLHDEYALLLVEDHVVVLRSGLVFDTDATVWDVDSWLHAKNYTCCGLLVARE